MKIAVLAKQVPDTWQPRTLDMDTGMVVRDGAAEPVPDEISERALEVVLGHRDGGVETEVVAVTMGPENSSKTLRKLLSMGADSAVQVTDERLAGSDAVQTARVLAAVVESVGADLVVGGAMSTDGNAGVVPAMVAELLGRPCLPSVEGLEVTADGVAGALVSGDAETRVSAGLPAVASVTERTEEPRFPSFKDIRAAKKKSLDTLTLDDLGLTAGPADADRRSVMVSSAARPEKQAGPKVVDDGTAAQQLMDFLVENRLV